MKATKPSIFIFIVTALALLTSCPTYLADKQEVKYLFHFSESAEKTFSVDGKPITQFSYIFYINYRIITLVSEDKEMEPQYILEVSASNPHDLDTILKLKDTRNDKTINLDLTKLPFMDKDLYPLDPSKDEILNLMLHSTALYEEALLDPIDYCTEISYKKEGEELHVQIDLDYLFGRTQDGETVFIEGLK